MELNRNVVSCAIIRTDLIRQSAKDEKDYNYGRAFYINPSDIEEVMKAIKTTSEEIGMPITRTYISGFGLVSKNDIWSKEKIINYLIIDIEAIKDYESGKVAVKKINY